MFRNKPIAVLFAVLMPLWMIGCSEKKSSSAAPAAPVIPETPAASAPSGAAQTSEFTEAKKTELRQIYSDTSADMLTSGDLIMKDFADGKMSEAVMKKQKICLWFHNDCLLSQYRDSSSGEFCGNQQLKEIEQYVKEDPAFASFAAGLTSGSQGPVVGNKMAKALYGEGTNIGGYRYQLSPSDPYPQEVKELDTTVSFSAGDQTFRIFYRSVNETVVQEIQKAVTAAYPILKNNLFEGTAVVPFGDASVNNHEYRIFLIDVADQKAREKYRTKDLHHTTYADEEGAGGSYIELLNLFGGNDEKRFHRANVSYTAEEDIRFTTIHELTHAFEYAYFKGFMPDLMAEGLATFGGEYVYPSINAQHENLPDFLYHMDRPIYSGPTLKPYGAYLAFHFVYHYYNSLDSIVGYLHILKTKNTFADEAIQFLFSNGSGDGAREFQQFALSNLNLSPSPKDVRVNYPQTDSSYQPLYLTATRWIKLLPGLGVGPEPVITEAKVDVSMPPFSIKYYLFVDKWGDSVNHVFEIDGSSLVGQGINLEALYLKINQDNLTDYKILEVKDLTENGGVDKQIFDNGMDQEPDIILVVLSNSQGTTGGENIAGSLTVKTKPFEGDPTIQVSHVTRPSAGETGPAVQIDWANVLLQYRPEAMESQGFTDPTVHYKMFAPKVVSAPNGRKFFQSPWAIQGEYTWRVTGHSESVSLGSHGLNCTKSTEDTGSGNGVLPESYLDLTLIDFQNGSQVEGAYTLLTDLEAWKFQMTYKEVTTCTGDCSLPCGGTKNVTAEQTIPAPAGNFSKGATQLKNPSENETPEDSLTWTITFPQPVDVLKTNSDNASVPLQSMKLLYINPTDPLFMHLRAPLLDFVRQ